MRIAAEKFSLGKRRIINSSSECKHDMSKILPLLFQSHSEAVELYNTEIVQTPVEARNRCLEANLLNSKIMQCVQKHFPNDWILGKYKRFIVRKDGYLILFKKLDKKDMPMNIKTKSSIAIENQLQKSLFDDMGDVFEPVVFFGYRKDRFGNIHSPKLVYIDEGKVRFEITEKEIVNATINHAPISFHQSESASIQIKKNARTRLEEAANE